MGKGGNTGASLHPENVDKNGYVKLGACGQRDRQPGVLAQVAKLKDELPTKKMLKAEIPAHCFVRDNVASLGLVVRDGIIIAAIGFLGWQLPTEFSYFSLDFVLWNMY